MQSSTAAGGGFLELLTIAFVVLKLTGVIAWSWWWVFSPILLLVGIVVACAIFTVVYEAWIETPGNKAARLMREYSEKLTGRKS